MAIDPALMRELYLTFRDELDEQIQSMTANFLALEREVPAEELYERLNDVFRSAHNIKGAARGLELKDIADIAHRLEEIFSALKQRHTAPTAEQVDRCLEAIDGIRVLFNDRFEALFGGQAPADQPAVQLARLAPHVVPGGEPQRAAADEPAGAPASLRIRLDRVGRLSATAEELVVARLQMHEQLRAMQQVAELVQNTLRRWKRAYHDRARLAEQPPAEVLEKTLAGIVEGVAALKGGVCTARDTLQASSARLDALIGSLIDDVHQLRMMPCQRLFRPLGRSVRDIARQLGKQVELRIGGGDIELDKVVLDALHDPLQHLLRNAIDHGIETPAQRTSQGKPEQGMIGLAARSAGSEVIIEIEDDGAGLDTSAIARAAVERGLLDEQQAREVSPEACHDLIFHPGFSSRREVSEISGRGVGLDVVRHNVTRLGGTVQVHSAAGKGCRFTLRLPLTLATERALFVRAADARYAVPSQAVARVLSVAPHDRVEIEGREAILLDGEPLLLCELGAVLGLAPVRRAREDLSVVVVTGWRSVALVVDDILGEREALIKPLREPLRYVRFFSGVTLSQAGEAILVLNAAELIEGVVADGTRLARIGTPSPGEVPRRVTVLVADDSITTRTLEKSILESIGCRVLTAADGKQAWDLLQRESVDILVTDVEMPNMDGLALTRTVKASRRHAALPVIMVTSRSNERDRQSGMEAGADVYIVKSEFETRVLLDAVRGLM